MPPSPCDDGMQPVVSAHACKTHCTCGGSHPEPRTCVYSGEDAFERLAAACSIFCAGGIVMVVCDPDTDLAAGAAVAAALRARQVRVEFLRLARGPEADAHSSSRIQERCREHALIVAVGSGTINDLCKYAAGMLRKPYWCVPTAPSMNGYTSGIAAIKCKGVKRTLPSSPPERIYAHPGVIRTAPLKLRQAGFCDVLAKSVSDVDWQIESMLFSGTYCRLPATLVASMEPRYAGSPEAIGAGDAASISALFQALLVSGAAMALAGSSAPASGGEHLVSHFLDMREPVTRRTPELHGLQVGAGIIFSAVCYAHLAALSAEALRPDAETAWQRDADRIPAIWPGMAEEVAAQFREKRPQLVALNHLLPANWPQLSALFQTVRPPAYFADLFRRTGYPITLSSLNLSAEEFLLACRNCRTIRNRITIADIAAHAGVIDAAAREALDWLTGQP